MKNVVLIGFMGTGKTSTGRALAQRLGRAFVDLDRMIEEEAGRSIPEIFASEGEAAFRALEREAVRRTAKRRALVISTGGGTVKDAANMALLKENDGLCRRRARTHGSCGRSSRARRKGCRRSPAGGGRPHGGAQGAL